MGSALHVLESQRFERLVTLNRVENAPTGHQQWLCICDCGVELVVTASHLLRKEVKSCGCLRSEKSAKRGAIQLTTHGHARHGQEHPLYFTWCGMRSRCHNPNASNYADYGGRGIYVCDRWLDDFEGLDNLAADMGDKPTPRHSLDRIDNDGPYGPENCRWATPAEQAQNRGPVIRWKDRALAAESRLRELGYDLKEEAM